MFLNYRTLGFILNKEDRGEADQLLTVYTRDFGKLKILARSIRKTSSKLRAGTEIFYLSEIEFIQGKTNKTLTDALYIEKFKNLRQDLNRLKIAYQIADVVDKSLPAPQKDTEIWNLLVKVFSMTNDQKFPSIKLKFIHKYFLLNFRSSLGYGSKRGNVTSNNGVN